MSHDLHFITSMDNTTQPMPEIPPVPTLSQPSMMEPLPQQQSLSSSSYVSQLFQSSAHPITCIFHVLFKGLAIITYLLGGIVEHSLNFITVTVCCILLLAIDFWVVKNVTGRLLVGLRWWAQVDLNANNNNSNGISMNVDETKWIFESKENIKLNSFDQTWFWTTLYVTPGIWILFFIMGLLKFNFGWLITDSFGIALNCANVYGYWRCSKDQKAKFQQMVQKGAEMGAASALRHNLFGKMAGMASSFAGAAGNVNNNNNTYTVV